MKLSKERGAGSREQEGGRRRSEIRRQRSKAGRRSPAISVFQFSAFPWPVKWSLVFNRAAFYFAPCLPVDHASRITHQLHFCFLFSRFPFFILHSVLHVTSWLPRGGRKNNRLARLPYLSYGAAMKT